MRHRLAVAVGLILSSSLAGTFAQTPEAPNIRKPPPPPANAPWMMQPGMTRPMSGPAARTDRPAHRQFEAITNISLPPDKTGLETRSREIETEMKAVGEELTKLKLDMRSNGEALQKFSPTGDVEEAKNLRQMQQEQKDLEKRLTELYAEIEKQKGAMPEYQKAKEKMEKASGRMEEIMNRQRRLHQERSMVSSRLMDIYKQEKEQREKEAQEKPKGEAAVTNAAPAPVPAPSAK